MSSYPPSDPFTQVYYSQKQLADLSGLPQQSVSAAMQLPSQSSSESQWHPPSEERMKLLKEQMVSLDLEIESSTKARVTAETTAAKAVGRPARSAQSMSSMLSSRAAERSERQAAIYDQMGPAYERSAELARSSAADDHRLATLSREAASVNRLTNAEGERAVPSIDFPPTPSLDALRALRRTGQFTK